ncbi:MAG: GH1 family beta-glucosidase [Gammaproteobacteria bacterium]|nr:GH1 family beta-glucosidase [Gammaproteobacteria bacterium]MDH4312325.1 GH1 family beta-glucosidase [Gammaproteobacteria bacterium]
MTAYWRSIDPLPGVNDTMLMKSDERSTNAVFSHDAGVLAERFPRSFVWGVATSAYQVEGAAHEDGRGDSIWDEFCRRPGAIKDGSSGERACDHYHRVAEDIGLMASLGVNAYRFSLAWPRVQPLGAGNWNEQGFEFYDRLLDGLLERGIAPYLTLYHWDLPQSLQQGGGWLDRDTVGRFADYAAEVARRFGSRAAAIATHNEPWVVAILGHEAGTFAPGLKSRKSALQVAHHLLLSHGLASQAMRAQHCTAPLGIVLNQSPIHPATDSPQDLARARLDDGLTIRWYMDPLLRGRYPEDVLAFLGEDAPQVAPGDMEAIRQPLDFLGINYYTRNLSGTEAPLGHVESGKEVTDMGWEVFPGGLSELLMRLQADYRLPPLYITENGAAYRDRLVDGRVADADRIRYLQSHIASLADALESGVDVRGYFVWSLIDNFEWADGYTKRFGLVYVDYATQHRTPKDSALWYQAFCLRARAAAGGGSRATTGQGNAR